MNRHRNLVTRMRVLGLLILAMPIGSHAVEDQFQPSDHRLMFDNGIQEQSVNPLIGDFNNDGLMDIFFYASPDDGAERSGMYWVANEGDRFPYGQREVLDRSSSFSVIRIQNAQYIGAAISTFERRRTLFKDINSDGRLDVVVVELPDFSGSDNEIYAAINTGGSPRFLAPELIASLESSARVNDFVDLDNDGDLDVVDRNAVVYLNEGNPGVFGPFSSPVFVGPDEARYGGWIAAFGDINNDGYVDIIRSGGNGVFQLLNNRSAIPFSENTPPLPVRNSTEELVNEIELAHLDEDDALDMVVVATGGGATYFLNEGVSAPFTNAPSRLLGPSNASNTQLVLADFNSDGRVDAFLCRGDEINLYVNSGEAVPFAASLVPAVVPEGCSIPATAPQIADIDLDGDTDYFRGSKYFLNNGFRQTPMPVLTVPVDSVVLSDAGSIEIKVELRPAQAVPVSMEFGTVAGSARPGDHYYGVFEEIVFQPGETGKSVQISILDGAIPRYARFYGVFSLIDGANITDDFIRVRIEPPLQDIAPDLTIPDSSAEESDGRMTFGMSLSTVTSRTVTVRVETKALAGGATPGEDYLSTAETITFLPNERIKFFTVKVVSDVESEADEEFGIEVTAIENANVISDNITGTIEDDDDGPVRAFISVDQLEVEEGDVAEIPVELSRNLSRPVTVGIATRSKTATSGQDFYGFFQVLTFEAGETRKIVRLITLEDTIDEPVEEIGVRLLAPGEGVDIGNSSGYSGEVPVKIRETLDLPGELSVAGFSCVEGDDCQIRVSLSRAYVTPVTVSLATRALTAVQGRDFYGLFRTMTFAPGETTKTTVVTTLDNTVDEADRSFEARIFGSNGAPIAMPLSGPVFIRDND